LAHAVVVGMTDLGAAMYPSMEHTPYAKSNDRRVDIDALLSFPGRNARRDGRLVDLPQDVVELAASVKSADKRRQRATPSQQS
jgi:hypothetical protein